MVKTDFRLSILFLAWFLFVLSVILVSPASSEPPNTINKKHETSNSPPRKLVHIEDEWLESPFDRGATVITGEHIVPSFWEDLPAVKINHQDPSIRKFGDQFYLCSGVFYFESPSGALKILRIPTSAGNQSPVLNAKLISLPLRGEVQSRILFTCVTSRSLDFGTGTIRLKAGNADRSSPWISIPPDQHNDAQVGILYPVAKHKSKLRKIVEENFPEFPLEPQ